MNQYLEVNDNDVAVGGVYDDAGGITIPDDWRLISGKASIGWSWDNASNTWSEPVDLYLQVDADGIAESGPYLFNPSKDLPSNWRLIAGNAVVGCTYANGVWSEPVFPVVTEEEFRTLRNALLVKTDWRDLPSYPFADQLEWRAYRQELRDSLDGYVPIAGASFPEQPQ
jgi:hypothetical protein